jgi:hypothetical protein
MQPLLGVVLSTRGNSKNQRKSQAKTDAGILGFIVKEESMYGILSLSLPGKSTSRAKKD